MVTVCVYSSSLQTLIVHVDPQGAHSCGGNFVVSVQSCVIQTQDSFVIGILCGKEGMHCKLHPEI